MDFFACARPPRPPPPLARLAWRATQMPREWLIPAKQMVTSPMWNSSVGTLAFFRKSGNVPKVGNADPGDVTTFLKNGNVPGRYHFVFAK